MGTIQEYSDPLLDLLHSQSLNKDESLANELIEYIDSISDNELKKWCIDSLTILRNLEKIETTLDSWEFHTLNFREAGVSEDENNNKVSQKLAKRVITRLNSIRQALIDEKPEISISVQRARNVSKDVNLVITDAGTILVELTMRIVKLAKGLDQEVTIRYSRAKLSIIGIELTKLASENMIMDKEVVTNYKTFVTNLLNQLNSAVDNKDTVGLWESIAIIGDVEKMFNSMKEKNRQMGGSTDMSPSSSVDSDIPLPKKAEVTSVTSATSISAKYKYPSATKTPKTPTTSTSTSTSVFSSAAASASTINTESSTETSISALSAKEVFNNDKDLLRTKISDHMPSLMNAFKKTEPIPEEPVSTIDEDTNENEQPSEVEINIDTKIAPITPTLPSFFGTSILNAFYRPNVKDPIYINKDSNKDEEVDNSLTTSIEKFSQPDPSKSHILQQLSFQMKQKSIE